MPEATEAPPVVTTPPVVVTTPTPLFAGKFKTAEDLDKGYREVRKTIADKHGLDPLPENVTLIGDGGLFKDAATLEEAYKKSARLIGVRGQDEKPPPAGDLKIEAGDDKTAIEDSADVPTLVEKAGLKMSELAEQFTTTGDLSDEQYAAIRKARPSLSKADIKFIAEGMASKAVLQQQTQAAIRTEAIKLVGGEQQLGSLLHADTLSKFMSPAEIKDAGRRLADPTLAVGTVKDLQARYSAHVGASGGSVIAGSAPTGQSLPKSSAEFVKIVDRAAGGDRAAMAMLESIPQTHIDTWKVKVS